jgi:cell division protein FtsL
MAVNTYKRSEEGGGGGVFTWLKNRFRISERLEGVIHVQFLPQILFICVLCLLYIANRHNAEKKIRTINRLEIEVEDLRADFTTLQADYMYASKQSEVARRAARLGLKENNGEPIVITKTK